MTAAERDELPIEVPDGVRLAWDDRGTERAVFVVRNRPCTAAGEIPKARPPRRARVADPGAMTLFGPAGDLSPAGPKPADDVVILVYAPQARADEAVAVANRLTRKGYAAESRIEPKAVP